MSKKSSKSNAFPVEEAINAASKFDISSKDAGVVELLSGNKAMEKFYSMRADGQYFKPHQIYFAVYRSKTEFQAPVASKHHLESTGTITDCAKAHPDVFDAEPDFNTYIKYIGDGQMQPAGTPFHMMYLTGDDEERSNIVGTTEVSDKTLKNVRQVMRTYLATRIIPKMGRSIMRESTSRFGIKTKGTTSEALTCNEVKADGTVCGGVYRKDSRGDYVCQNCGLIYEREDKFIAEDIGQDEEFDSEGDEEYVESAPTQKYLQTGGRLPSEMMAVEARLNKNLREYRERIATAPKDEVAAQEREAEKAAKDAAARKYWKSISGHTVYENKWSDAKSKAIAARVLHAIKHDNLTAVNEIVKALGVHNMYVVRAVDTLVKAGRVSCTVLLNTPKKVVDEAGNETIVMVAGTGKGKKTVLEYIPSGKELKGKCAKVQVMPVLPQVKYGGVARHSDMGSIYQSRCSVCQHKFYATHFNQFVCPECEGQ